MTNEEIGAYLDAKFRAFDAIQTERLQVAVASVAGPLAEANALARKAEARAVTEAEEHTRRATEHDAQRRHALEMNEREVRAREIQAAALVRIADSLARLAAGQE